MLPSGKILRSRYQLEGIIDRSSLFDLYVAKDLHFSGKFWFIKELKIFLQDGNSSIAREFQERASSLSRIDHPYIAKIIDYFMEDGKFYLVYEHKPGQTLKSMLRSNQSLKENQVIEIFNRLSEAVEYLHNQRQPILLLNLNPGHIYLHTSGVILLEYGFSPFLAQCGKIKYLLDDSLGYCAPEMLKPKINADNRSDIYSIGVILHYVLTGIDPRNATSFASIRIKNPDVSSQMEIFVKKAIGATPGERFPSLSVFRKELNRIPRVQKTPEKAVRPEIARKSTIEKTIEKNLNVDKEPVNIAPKSTAIKQEPVIKTKKIIFNDDIRKREKEEVKIHSSKKIDIPFKSIFLVLFSLIVIGALGFFLVKFISTMIKSSHNDEDSNPYKITGIENYNKGNYIEAIENFTKSLNKNPSDGLASIYLQNSYLKMNKEDTVLIGLSVSLSGYNKEKGADLIRGIALAQLKVNEKKGDKENKPLEILVKDDESTIAGAIEGANFFTGNKNIVAVIGNNFSDQAKAVAPVYNNKKIVCISPTATCPGLDTLGPYVFRLSGKSNLQPDAIARFCIEQANLKKVAIMYDDTQDYSSGMAHLFKNKVLELGGTVIQEKTFTADSNDLPVIADDIVKSSPEVLFFSGYQKEGATTAKILREKNCNVQILGGDALYTKEIIDIGGKSVEGIIFTSFFHTDYNNKTREFTKIFQSKFNVLPSARSALAYDALTLLSESKSQNGNDVRDYLLSFNSKSRAFEGVTGETYFDKEGNSFRDLFLITVKNGKFILVCKLDSQE